MVLYMLYSYAKIQNNFKPPKKGCKNRELTKRPTAIGKTISLQNLAENQEIQRPFSQKSKRFESHSPSFSAGVCSAYPFPSSSPSPL